jgi:hypothetical protein
LRLVHQGIYWSHFHLLVSLADMRPPNWTGSGYRTISVLRNMVAVVSGLTDAWRKPGKHFQRFTTVTKFISTAAIVSRVLNMSTTADQCAGAGVAELGHLPHLAFLSPLKEQTNAGQQG